MSEPRLPLTPSEALEEFYQDFAETHLACEHGLIELEQRPDDRSHLDRLKTRINGLKSAMIYAGMRDFSVLMQGIEDVMAALVANTLEHDTLLNDVLLLAMDQTRILVEARMKGAAQGMEASALAQLGNLLCAIGASTSSQGRDILLHAAMQAMNPEALNDRTAPPELPPETVSATAITTTVATDTPLRSTMPDTDDMAKVLAHFGISMDDDLRWFAGLVAPMEARSMYWNNCTARILTLCLAMNQRAENPVDPYQLTVAVLLHDMGMALLPVEILHKRVRLETDEIAMLQTHPERAAQLLSAMPRWERAARIIRQHHERVDGHGYPAALEGDAICAGARILAIADTFEARTHERAYSTRIKRPFIRAILEINSCSGTQFDPFWVAIFNDVARDLDPKL